MAKKLRKSLNEDTHFIKRGAYSTSAAKVYLIVALITFHIVPLILVFMGKTGLNVLMHTFLYTINIIVIFAIGAFYGIRNGYNMKFPFILFVIAFLSYVFYYNDSDVFDSAANYVMTGTITFITYALFSYVSTAIGGWAKRFF